MSKNLRIGIIYSLFLVLLIAISYHKVIQFDFINFDDPDYVTENRIVQKGVTFEGLKWAFSFKDNDLTYWHPLTYLFHMIDCQFFGLTSGLHHLSNLILHIINVVLFFTLIVSATGRIRVGIISSLLFAVHPVCVDAVVWISQKKTLLAAGFWLSGLIAYSEYIKKGGIGRYLIMCFLLICGLMSKPVMVAFPLILLCMDFWPVNRFRNGSVSIKRIIIEKIPPVIFALMWAGTIFIPEHVLAKNISFEEISLILRLKNMVVSYLIYLQQFFFPRDLVIINPYPDAISWVKAGAAFVMIAIFTVLAFRAFKKAPFILFGWMVFLIAIGPSSGLIQGAVWPAHADRFAYIPYTGLYIIAGCSLSMLMDRFASFRRAAPAVLVSILLLLSFLTFNQTRFWKNSKTVYKHAIDRTEKNHVAYNNLGTAYQAYGDTDTALKYFFTALWARPGYSKALHNIAIAYIRKERFDDAIFYFKESLKANPYNHIAHYNIGSLYEQKGVYETAVFHFSESIRIMPGFADAYNNIGAIYQNRGEVKKAAQYYKKALDLNPEFVNAMCNMGNILIDYGKMEKAIVLFQRALSLEKENMIAMNGLAVAYMTSGQIDRAEKYVQQMINVDPENAIVINNMRLLNQLKSAVTDKLNQSKTALMILEETGGTDTFAKYAVLCKIGQLEEKLGSYNSAGKNYLEATTIIPERHEALILLGALYEKTGDYSNAIIFYNRVAETSPERRGEAYYDIAGIFGRNGNPVESVRWLSRAVDEGFEDWKRLREDVRFSAVWKSDEFQEFAMIAGIQKKNSDR